MSNEISAAIVRMPATAEAKSAALIVLTLLLQVSGQGGSFRYGFGGDSHALAKISVSLVTILKVFGDHMADFDSGHMDWFLKLAGKYRFESTSGGSAGFCLRGWMKCGQRQQSGYRSARAARFFARCCCWPR
ncbi:hypothetical protein [Pseudoxanthomonas sp. CF125]|uniref:hypothetical protein n=1 Tax=Pseudoxanthomonas sp. CF125 TaxID=1855303 RepID=UPI0015A29193|nr:hypothetical protein [Pseudoxanthomonas sp. CF125]